MWGKNVISQLKITENLCYLPPPPLNRVGLWRSRKILLVPPPPTLNRVDFWRSRKRLKKFNTLNLAALLLARDTGSAKVVGFYYSSVKTHRCQHQRTKKRDSPDEKAWKAVVSKKIHHQGAQLVLWNTTSSSLAAQTRRQRPSAGCAWQWISRTRSQMTSSCRFRSQRQTYWCCPNVTEPLRCMLAARSMWRFTSCLPDNWLSSRYQDAYCMLHSRGLRLRSTLVAGPNSGECPCPFAIRTCIPRQISDSPCSQCNFRQASEANLN